MNTLIPPTEFTPLVGFDRSKNTLCMAGVCAPENAHLFFDALEESLVLHVQSAPKIATIYFEMEYFNSASTRIILDIIRGTKPKDVFTEQTAIVWAYDEKDEEMLDAGKLLEELTERDFLHFPKQAIGVEFQELSLATQKVLSRTSL